MKDFAESLEYRAWVYAVNTHSRMNEWIRRFEHNQKMVDYAKESIAKLEEKYPQLKK